MRLSAGNLKPVKLQSAQIAQLVWALSALNLIEQDQGKMGQLRVASSCRRSIWGTHKEDREKATAGRYRRLGLRTTSPAHAAATQPTGTWDVGINNKVPSATRNGEGSSHIGHLVRYWAAPEAPPAVPTAGASTPFHFPAPCVNSRISFRVDRASPDPALEDRRA